MIIQLKAQHVTSNITRMQRFYDKITHYCCTSNEAYQIEEILVLKMVVVTKDWLTACSSKKLKNIQIQYDITQENIQE